MVTQQDETSRPKQKPVRVVIGEGFDDSHAKLHCPECACGEVHIGPVNIEQGYTNTHVGREHAITLPSDRHERCRGSEVSLTFCCEAGHEFRYIWSFHKGSTYLQLATSSTEMPGEFLQPELWRD